MEHQGGCQCGAVRYAVQGTPEHVALCYCADCRRSSGAPAVSWAAFPAGQFALLQGELKAYSSNGTAIREFCPNCGTGIAYRNEAMLPGLVDIQAATLDDPESLPPQAQIQTADRVSWMERAHELPAFERYPGQ